MFFITMNKKQQFRMSLRGAPKGRRGNPLPISGGSFYNSARTFEGDCHTSLVPQHCASEQPPKAALSESQCALVRNDIINLVHTVKICNPL